MSMDFLWGQKNEDLNLIIIVLNSPLVYYIMYQQCHLFYLFVLSKLLFFFGLVLLFLLFMFLLFFIDPYLINLMILIHLIYFLLHPHHHLHFHYHYLPNCPSQSSHFNHHRDHFHLQQNNQPYFLTLVFIFFILSIYWNIQVLLLFLSWLISLKVAMFPIAFVIVSGCAKFKVFLQVTHNIFLAFYFYAIFIAFTQSFINLDIFLPYSHNYFFFHHTIYKIQSHAQNLLQTSI